MHRSPDPGRLCQVNRGEVTVSSFEGVANGGDSGFPWWARDRRITVCVRALGVHARMGMPEASRVPVRRVATAGSVTVYVSAFWQDLAHTAHRWFQRWRR